MKKWNQKIRELLEARSESEKEYNKSVVAIVKFGAVVGYLSEGKTGLFVKTILFFLSASNGYCSVTLKIPCKLYFTREVQYIK